MWFLTLSPERSDGYNVPLYCRGGAVVVGDCVVAAATAAATVALIDPCAVVLAVAANN